MKSLNFFVLQFFKGYHKNVYSWLDCMFRIFEIKNAKICLHEKFKFFVLYVFFL